MQSLPNWKASSRKDRKFSRKFNWNSDRYCILRWISFQNNYLHFFLTVYDTFAFGFFVLGCTLQSDINNFVNFKCQTAAWSTHSHSHKHNPGNIFDILTTLEFRNQMMIIPTLHRFINQYDLLVNWNPLEKFCLFHRIPRFISHPIGLKFFSALL